jgi:hypothetical protein
LLARTSDRENRHPSTADRDEPARDLADLKEYISGLHNNWLQLAGVETLVAAIETDSFPPPPEFDLYDVPVLTGADSITPIETLDELLDTVAHAVEIVDSIDEVERILDGISRLCDQKPEDFERRTAPLVKRIFDGPASGSSHGLIAGWSSLPSLLLLLMAWLRPQPTMKRNRMQSKLTGPMTVMEARLKELVDRVLYQQPAPLLAAPTHTHGWIDPTVLVDRVVALQAAEQPIPKHDLIQALLRMTPDHRQEACQAVANIHGNVGRVIRWALDGDEQPQRNDRSEASLWLAAGRARSPKARIEMLTGFKLNRVGPDGIEPATYLWQATTKEVKDPWSSQVYHLSQLDLKPRPAGPTGKKLADLPTVALHKKGGHWVIHHPDIPWLVHWIKQIWPQNVDPFFAAGAVALASRIDDNSSNWYPNFVYVTPLLEPDRPLSEMAILVLWLALVGKDADARGYAIDAVAEAIQDGRAHPDILGPVLIQLSQGGWLKLNRLAASLGEVARLSAWHQFVIVRVLEAWLAARTDLPRDAHHILSLLLELLTSLDLGLAEKARVPLEQKKGSSKTAKTARAILDRSGSDRSLKTSQALIEQLRSRIERAERWQYGRHWFQYESQH